MRRSQRPIRIVSRRSLLARAQAEMIGRHLAQANPGLTVEFLWLESAGDQKADVALADAGGKGLFVREVERALLDGEAHLAVHSLKDLPARDTPGLVVAAVPPREEVRDCMITLDAVPEVASLKPKAVIGTASPRRAAQLLRARPDLVIRLIRGNVDTRLRKVLQDKQYDATLLAAAGLRRLGLRQHAAVMIPTEVMLPAACQGALALQCRGDDHATLTRCLPLNDGASAQAVNAERRLVAELQADCHSPIAVLVEIRGTEARLRVRVLSDDGSECLEADHATPARGLGRLVRKTARDLLARGAARLLHPA